MTDAKLVVRYKDFIPAEFFGSCISDAERGSIPIELERVPTEPTASIGWLMASGLLVYLSKPFVDEILKRAATDVTDKAYPKLKSLLTKLATKTHIGVGRKWGQWTPSRRLPRKGKSAFFRIDATTRNGLALHFIFDEGLKARAYKACVDEALQLICDQYSSTHDDILRTATSIWNSIYMFYDDKTQTWRPIDVMEEIQRIAASKG